MPIKPKVLDETRSSLQRLQDFDPKTLGRVEDFGQAMNFSAAVPAAERLLGLYKRVPVTIVDDLNEQLAQQLRSVADADYSRLEQIRNFDPEQTNAAQMRRQLIASMEAAYDSTFQILWTYIAYGVARVTDSSLLENQARSTLQQMRDGAKDTIDSLNKSKSAADEVLANIQKVAAEQGVSQQAHFFKTQADAHDKEAQDWAGRIWKFAAAITVFAVLSLGLHKIAWLAPANTYEAAQLISSKIIVFAVLGFLLALASKNYLSHRHNSVVNRHRQTALQTYRSLADAAKEDGARDIVVAHAASCIFSPQDTGYSKVESASGAKSVLELLTKSAPKGGGE